ncbi:hypothetical protein BZA77DRAFT_314287 [Pyronema omphalodes]|nr:hypothetical protein BZA77DRAFT_314287 [Pyronema omphalodes]
MADESELSAFRRQWQAEVSARKSGTSTKTSGDSKHARPGTSQRRPSATAAPTSPTARRASVTAARRPSVTAPVVAGPSSVSSAAASAAAPGSGFAGPSASNIPMPAPVTTGFPSPTPLKTGSKKTPQSALEHYEAAVEREASGDLGESLKLYRQAFKLDDRVDKAYKEKYFPAVKKTVDSAIAAVKSGEKEKGAGTRKEKEEGMPSMSEMVKSFASLGIEVERKPVVGGRKTEATEEEEQEEEEGEKKFCLLAEVPGELLLQILRHLALMDVAAYVRLGQVCKHLCYVVSSEESIWAEVTRRTFKKQVWDWKVEVDGTELPEPEPFPEKLSEDLEEGEEFDGELTEGESARIIPVDNEELEKYNGSWKEMFHLRPRLRFNGVYISTCNYHRAGGHMGSALTWGTPVHTVTYYRYLRFYPDGTLLSLLTTHGPAEVVYLFSKPSLLPAALKGHPTTSAIAQWAPYVCRGRWRLDHEGRVDIETEVRNLKRYLFRMQFRVRNVKGRGAVKLNWEGFWSWNKLTDDLAAFEGRNDKPFFFSRVVAAEKEMGVEL